MKKTKWLSLIAIVAIPWTIAIIGITACVPTLPAGQLCIKFDISCEGDCHCLDYTYSKVTVVDEAGDVWTSENFAGGQFLNDPICINNLPSDQGLMVYADIMCDGQKVHGNIGDYCSRHFSAGVSTSLPTDQGRQITLKMYCI